VSFCNSYVDTSDFVLASSSIWARYINLQFGQRKHGVGTIATHKGGTEHGARGGTYLKSWKIRSVATTWPGRTLWPSRLCIAIPSPMTDDMLMLDIIGTLGSKLRTSRV
jgi:hypothetical protein